MFFGIIKKPLNPCKEGDSCLVRASCQIFRDRPWHRHKECSIYKNYSDKKSQYNELESKIDDIVYWFILSILFSIVVVITAIFAVGLITVCEAIFAVGLITVCAWIWAWLF
jgi:hypothetical protein